ncbi:MAG: ABC transporter ATP-binding protein [Candidatus Brockarchaeota archaeon]|nr:ABC transporter ATP-binding protein [Candidatus Brockarchaeota archaeon]
MSKSFGKVKALVNIDMRAPKGIDGLIGPNGAGKTTLIHILTGLIKPDSGNVEVMGLEPWSKRQQLMKMLGVMLERPIFPQKVSGMRYMLHATRVKGLPESEAIEALREVDLLDSSERKIAGYSAGMMVRLGIARAMLGDPEMLILDEPTANLDPKGRIRLLRLFKKMHSEKGTNFLISSHILPELQKVCSWVCMMQEGKIVEQDYVDNLLDKYSSQIYTIKVSRPNELANALRNLGLQVKVKGNTIYIRGEALVIRRKVPKLIGQTDEEMISFHQLGRNLENVFIKALRRHNNRIG